MKNNCYIKFAVKNEDRFNKLVQLFNKLRCTKNKQFDNTGVTLRNTTDIPKWTGFLDKDALDWYAKTFDYEGEEGKVYRKLWELTTPEIRTTSSFFKTPGNWHFDSVIDAILAGNYELIEIHKIRGTNEAVLYYRPFGIPFGDTECLVELLESFGNIVLYDSWHNGPHKRQPVGWNYSRAKLLVNEKKGVDS
ncbi:MAG: hypothetical protein GY754_29335 [bacterium]|nr:hypothetical protein [bacterium]